MSPQAQRELQRVADLQRKFPGLGKPHFRLYADGRLKVKRFAPKAQLSEPAVASELDSFDGFRKRLQASNQTIADWSRGHEFDPEDVYQVLRGVSLGRRGKARSILLAMGVRPPAMFNKTKAKA